MISRDEWVLATGVARQDSRGGYDASWRLPFVVALRRGGRWSSFAPHPVLGGMCRALLGLAPRRCVYRALDDSGARLGLFTRPCAGPMALCPEDVAYVVGDPRGFSPCRFADSETSQYAVPRKRIFRMDEWVAAIRTRHNCVSAANQRRRVHQERRRSRLLRAIPGNASTTRNPKYRCVRFLKRVCRLIMYPPFY